MICLKIARRGYQLIERIKKTLTWVICKTLPDCKNVTEVISRSMETQLSWHEKLLLKLHLLSCVACSRYFAQLKFMSKVFEIQTDKFEQKPVSALSADAVERLKKKLKPSKFLLIFVLMTFLF